MTMPSKIWAKQTTGWGGLVGGQFRNHPADDCTPYIRADIAEELARALEAVMIGEESADQMHAQMKAQAALARFRESSK